MERTETKHLNVSGIDYTYDRPIQVRNIPPKATSVRGHMPSLKVQLRGIRLDYESKLERQWLELLDHDPNCIDLQPQPFELWYTTSSGKSVAFYPDVWAIFKDKGQFLFDVKQEKELADLKDDDDWIRRLDSVFQFCKKNKMTYQIITERKFRCTRLDNVEDLLVAAKHFSPMEFKDSLDGFDTCLKAILGESSIPFRQLVTLMSTKVRIPVETVISLIKHKIYHGTLSIDWDSPLETTPVSLAGKLPIPVHELPDNEPTGSHCHMTGLKADSNDEGKARVLFEKDKQVYDERAALISPVVQSFGKDARKSDIKQYCQDNKQSFSRVYRWYLDWKRGGSDAFKPRRGKHEKSHLHPRVEEMLIETVRSWNNGKSRSKTSAYAEFCKRCIDAGFSPATYKTFLARIGHLPFSVRHGKYPPKTLTSIDRALHDTFRDKRYPGFLVQMDNALLDIWCVDQFSKQPIGRPWLTMGVDVFSGEIWGFFLSFENPSFETVTRAIINGVSKKEETQEWKAFKVHLLKNKKDPSKFNYPCAGFPAIIQVDNGKDFQANNLKEFCMALNITLEYRPVKTPDYGGFIESTWDTINDGIRNEQLPGCVYPIPKTREPVMRPKFKNPGDHDPKIDAKLTIDEFAEWLFEFLVIKYSNEVRARQQQAPAEIWCDGLSGANHQPMGGALRMASTTELQSLDFHSKRTIYKSLSRHGFRYQNLLYSSEWLDEARKARILKDKNKYGLKISHWDVRYAYILNPETHEIETLTAYKYDGDNRVNEFLRQGLGKIPSFKPFPIALSLIETIQTKLGSTSTDSKENIVTWELTAKKVQERSKRNKKERRLLENLARTADGKEKLTQSAIIAQLDQGVINVPSKQELLKQAKEAPETELASADKNVVTRDYPGNMVGTEEIDTGKASNNEIEAFPTELDQIPDDMKLSYMKR